MGDVLRRAFHGNLPLTMEETIAAERYEARRADLYRTSHGFRLAAIETRFDGVVDVLFNAFFKTPEDIVVLNGTGGLVIIGRYFCVEDILSELGEGRVVSGSEGTMISYNGPKTFDEVVEIALKFF